MNQDLVGKSQIRLISPEKCVLIFETTQPPGAVGGIRELAPNQHEGKSNYGFADGHSRALAVSEAAKMTWRPKFAPFVIKHPG